MKHKITKQRDFSYEYRVTAACTCGWFDSRLKGTYQTQTIKATNQELAWAILEHKEDVAEKVGA
jgi:hypothetical protein